MKELVWVRGSVDVVDHLLRPGGPNISTHARVLYLALWSYIGRDDTCHPSVGTLAAGTGMNERTVQRYIPELIEAGLIDRIEKPGRSTEYRLYAPWNPRLSVTPDQQSPLTESHPRPTVTGDSGSYTPDSQSPAPDSQSPEVTHLRNPVEETHIPEPPNATQGNGAKSRPTRTKKATEKDADPHKVAAQPLVRKFDAWLKEQNAPGVKEWPKVVTITAGALRGGKAGVPIPPEEADAALTWAMADQYWSGRLMAVGMVVLRDIWAKWKRGDTGPQRFVGGRQYQDHTRPNSPQPDPWN